MTGKKVVIAGSGQTARRLAKCLEDEGFQIIAFIDPSDGRAGESLRGKPIIGITGMGDFAGTPIVAASRASGARKNIREFLNGRGLIEMTDYIVCS